MSKQATKGPTCDFDEMFEAQGGRLLFDGRTLERGVVNYLEVTKARTALIGMPPNVQAFDGALAMSYLEGLAAMGYLVEVVRASLKGEDLERALDLLINESRDVARGLDTTRKTYEQLTELKKAAGGV